MGMDGTENAPPGRRRTLHAVNRTENRADASMTAAPARAVAAQGKPGEVAYILSMFPSLSETFILREIIELERRGIVVTIHSLRRCTDTLVHPGAQRLLDEGRVHYASRWRGLRRFFGYLVRQPTRMVALLRQFHASYRGSGLSLAKSYASMILAADILPRLQAQHATHVHAPWATYPSTAALFCSRMGGLSFSFAARAHDLFLEDHGLELKLGEARFAQTITEYNRSLIRRRYRHTAADRLHVIHSALDPADFPPRRQPADPPLLLSIGRMVPMKGFLDLVDACALMRDQGVPFQCRIVGKGPLRQEIQQRIVSHGLQAQVRLLEPMGQPEIRKLLAEATCFVLPCITASDGDQDGIPNVLMEALAARVPAVSCPTSGVPELIQHGKTGLLAEPRNPHSLALQIRRLLGDVQLRTRLAEAGRLKVEDEFNIKKNAARLASLFPAGSA